MKKNRKLTLGITLIITLLMAVLSTSMAFAQAGDVTGYIMDPYPGDDGTFTIKEETSGILYIVLVGDNFDFDKYLEGDLITIQGTVEDDVIVLTELKIMERARDQVKLHDGELESYYCDNEDQDHPVAYKVADTYGVDYDVIEGFLCGEPSVPLGQIMLAMQTAKLTGEDYTIYLNSDDPIKWGTIWEQGKPDKGTPPGQIQDKQGEDTDETETKGKKNQDSEELLECDEESGVICEVYEWFQSKSQKGKK